MAVATSTIAAFGLVGFGIATAIKSNDAARQANTANRQAREEQRASNAAQAAQERRAQIREERVRRARILQASEATGTSDSSGELGALGNLATSFNSAVGFNIGALMRSDKQSQLLQQAADSQYKSQKYATQSQFAMQVAGMTGSIFK